MADWYLMRATGVVSLLLFTLVSVLGIATVGRRSLGRTPRFVTAAVHRNLALVAVVFAGTHIVTGLLDPFAGVTVLSVVIPFVAHWRPLFVGLGTVSLDLLAAVIVTSLVRRRLRLGAWRAVHLLAYLAWPSAIVHTLGAGTDASSSWLSGMSIACIAAVALALLSRLFSRNPLQKHLEVPA